MKTRKKTLSTLGKASLTAAIIFATTAASLPAADAKGDEPLGPKPKDSPGWLVLEEDFWYPWSSSAGDWLLNAEISYRHNEEKKAAKEIRRAESWLDFAAGHAAPITKKSLESAAKTLTTLADDLDSGKIVDARRLDSAMSKANQALAEWHYFIAEDKLAKNDEKYAAEHLANAARYLQYAANSARYSYGDDALTLFEKIEEDGITVYENKVVSPSMVKKNLDALKSEIDKLSATLKNIT